jgi:hypothetical protein
MSGDGRKKPAIEKPTVERVKLVLDMTQQNTLTLAGLIETLQKLATMMPPESRTWAQSGSLVIEGHTVGEAKGKH